VELDPKSLNENTMLVVVKFVALVDNKVRLLVVKGRALFFVVVDLCSQNGRVSKKSDEFPIY
jgi:hypothetical protein